MIKTFDKQNLITLRKEFQDAIDAVATKHGLAAKLGSISFSETEFSVTMKCGSTDTDVINKKYATIFSMYGFPKDTLKRQFMYKNELYSIEGIKLGKTKYPVEVVRCKDKKPFGFAVLTIRELLK